MTAAYTDTQPEATFVAEDQGRVIGYLTGTVDTKRHWELWRKHVLPRVLSGFFGRGVWKNQRAWNFFYNGWKSAMLGQEQQPKNLLREYPAHFHINIEDGHRGGGVGHGLATAFLEHARSGGARGVHVRTTVPDGKNRFFESLGFQPLMKKTLTLWSYLQQPPHTIVTYGLKLTTRERHE